MHQTTFTELRNNAKHFFDLVEAGETVRVLRNGKPIAVISPATAETPSWKRRKPQPLVVEGVSISSLIIAERDE